MKFEGNVTINASQQEVWEFLTDPNNVAQCVPGLKSLEVVIPDKQFDVIASVGLGAVNVTFDASVEWVELEAPNLAKMKAHGTAPGSAVDVTSEMRLSSDENGITTLDWSADVVVVGTIASLASRLMPGITKKLSGTFFDCFKKQIEK